MKKLTIWSFVGFILMLYGALIFIAGVYYLHTPPAYSVALQNLNVSVWWGALLFIIGFIFSYYDHKQRNTIRYPHS